MSSPQSLAILLFGAGMIFAVLAAVDGEWVKAAIIAFSSWLLPGLLWAWVEDRDWPPTSGPNDISEDLPERIGNPRQAGYQVAHRSELDDPWGLKKPDPSPWWFLLPAILLAVSLASVATRWDPIDAIPTGADKVFEAVSEVADSAIEAVLKADDAQAAQTTKLVKPDAFDDACYRAIYEGGSDCESVYFLPGDPTISPRIIQDMSTWLSDGGDQVVGINVMESMGANRYYGDFEIDQFGRVEYRDVGHDGTVNGSFSYQHIGRTASGIHVLETTESGGGSGRFRSILLLRLAMESAADTSSWYADTQNVAIKPRSVLVIKKLGEFSLGDRWDGDLSVQGDTLLIGKDAGYPNVRAEHTKDGPRTVDLSEF